MRSLPPLPSSTEPATSKVVGDHTMRTGLNIALLLLLLATPVTAQAETPGAVLSSQKISNLSGVFTGVTTIVG